MIEQKQAAVRKGELDVAKKWSLRTVILGGRRKFSVVDVHERLANSLSRIHPSFRTHQELHERSEGLCLPIGSVPAAQVDDIGNHIGLIFDGVS